MKTSQSINIEKKYAWQLTWKLLQGVGKNQREEKIGADGN